MGKLNDKDYDRQIELEQLDKQVLAQIKRSYTWSMITWGGGRCSGCGKEVNPRCQTDLSADYLIDGKVTGIIQAYGNACDSRWFFDKCPGENPGWEMAVANQLIETQGEQECRSITLKCLNV